MREKKSWINLKIILPVMIILLLAVMVFYNMQNSDSRDMTFKEDKSIAKSVATTEEFRLWRQTNDKIIIAYDDDAAPYIYEDDNGDARGFFPDYFHTISEMLGIEVILIKSPDGETRQLPDGDKVHGRLIIADNEKSGSDLISMPIIPVKGAVCVSADKKEFNRDDFINARVAVISPSRAEEFLKNSDIKNTVTGGSIEECIDKLKGNDADCYVGNESAIFKYLLDNGLSDEFRITGEYIYSGNYCLSFSADSQAVYNVINNCIYNIDKSVLIPRLQGKWFGLPYSLYVENTTQHTSIILIILITSILCLFCLFYITNRGVYAELKDRTEVLLASKRELEATFDGVTYFIAEVDRDYRVLTLNKAFWQQINVIKREAEGRLISDLLNVVPAKKCENDLIGLIEKTFNEEEKKNGEYFSGKSIYNIHTFPIKNSKGRIAKVLLMIMDVTKERSVERQMIQDSKMIAVGQLASGVAHEIRNPLGVIMNYCYVLKNLDTGDEKSRLDAIRMIEKSVARSGRIIENLLNFSGLSNDRKELIDIKKHINSILSLHGNLNERKNKSVLFICPDDIMIYTSGDSLDMIMANLISNAVDAVGDQGAITIRCSQNDERVTIEVCDTGSGIPEDVIGDIYNPFFTTKPRHEGNGLGLYIVYNELKKLNGDISVESEPGKGTAFTVVLPKERA